MATIKMMNIHSVLASFALACSVSFAATAPVKAPRTLPGGWQYAWGDEFNGKKLNLKKWAYEEGTVRNRGASHAYVKKAVTLEDGKLVLTSRCEKTKNPAYVPGKANSLENEYQPYSSGSVTTRGVKEFTAPGRLEIRARIPKAKGVWPALWTMHVNNYGWPANGEIDILEHISQEPQACYSIFRWGRNGGNQEQKVIRRTQIPDYSKDFHVYVLEWDDDVMRVLVDDKEVGRVNIADANYPNGDNPLKTPCYLIMNTAIGGPGTWPEGPEASHYPVRFEIDYVRYYTKGDAQQSPSAKSSPSKKVKKRSAGKKTAPRN